MSFQKNRAVRIMCDWSAEGVWGVSIDELPVSRHLRLRILTWQEWWHTQDPLLDPDPSFNIHAFTAEGLIIARAVKAALPEWTVTYYDEVLGSLSAEFPGEEFTSYEINARMH